MGEACELTQKIKRKALELGFARVGVTTAEGSEQVRRFAQIAIKRIEAGGRGKEMNSR